MNIQNSAGNKKKCVLPSLICNTLPRVNVRGEPTSGQAHNVFCHLLNMGGSDRAQPAVFLQPLGPLIALRVTKQHRGVRPFYSSRCTLRCQHWLSMMFTIFQEDNSCIKKKTKRKKKNVAQRGQFDQTPGWCQHLIKAPKSAGSNPASQLDHISIPKISHIHPAELQSEASQ